MSLKNNRGGYSRGYSSSSSKKASSKEAFHPNGFGYQTTSDQSYRNDFLRSDSYRSSHMDQTLTGMSDTRKRTAPKSAPKPVPKSMPMPETTGEPMPKSKSMPEQSPPSMPRGDMLPSKTNYMTDSLGRPIPNDNNTLTVGPNGFSLLQDVHFIDKLAHFDRERIPERVVHAKGAGAFGVFENYKSMKEHTYANFLSTSGQKTKAFVRFSTVIGGRGSADTVRDPRGFAVKLYTEEGIHDIVGNDLPIFFIRDGIKFPDVIHSLKPRPDSNLPDPERFWDFVSLSPEATHMITWLYSDRGTIKSYRHVDGFGVNTYVWVNKSGERKFVKYHWKTMQGIQTINRHEATQLAGENPNIASEDLWNAIEAGNFPKYELCVQLMNPADADMLPFDPLDDTKTWDEEQFPLIKVGMLTLNKNPDNFFGDVEQAAFCPGNFVPGTELSADKMLQGRSFSYLDTQRYRIGTNFADLPVNKSKSPVLNNQRDGSMTYEYNKSVINYSPNSLNGNIPRPADVPPENGPFVEGMITRSIIHKTDDFTQAGERYRSFSPEEKAALVDNIAAELYSVKNDIKERVVSYFHKADHDFGMAVEEAMHMYSKKRK